MKKLLALAIVGAFAIAGSAYAADAPAPNSQQDRMKACNTKAEGKKGDERKAFMSACLSGKDVPVKMTQQEKMKACNVKAEGKKGDERKSFMSDCLKAAPPA
jgi:hypothetical protein